MKEKKEYNGLPVPNMYIIEQDIIRNAYTDGRGNDADNAGSGEGVSKDDRD